MLRRITQYVNAENSSKEVGQFIPLRYCCFIWRISAINLSYVANYIPFSFHIHLNICIHIYVRKLEFFQMYVIQFQFLGFIIFHSNECMYGNDYEGNETNVCAYKHGGMRYTSTNTIPYISNSIQIHV